MSGVAEKFLREIATTTVDTCIAWPFSTYRNGYGQCWFRNHLVPAHRAMTIIAHGEPPSNRYQAAHACGNKLCVNPRHLRWLTQSQNELDKRMHGTAQQGEHNGRAKLSEHSVSIIKALLSEAPDRILGPLFGVDRKTVSAIRYGRTWAFVPVAPQAMTFKYQEIVNQLEAKAA